MPSSLGELSNVLNVLLGGTLVSILVAGVASYRKIKSGAIVDDDAIIARLDADNIKLRAERDAALLRAESVVKELERERQSRWHAEDRAAMWRRQLIANGLTPEGTNHHDR